MKTNYLLFVFFFKGLLSLSWITAVSGGKRLISAKVSIGRSDFLQNQQSRSAKKTVISAPLTETIYYILQQSERQSAQGKRSGFEVDLNFSSGGKTRKASLHRCSQAAVRRTSTSPFNEDALFKPQDTIKAHILWFSKYTVHLKETHPSAFAGTSSLARCHWSHLGQSWRKEEAILFFSTGPETADRCTF